MCSVACFCHFRERGFGLFFVLDFGFSHRLTQKKAQIRTDFSLFGFDSYAVIAFRLIDNSGVFKE
jgi:hypothetical protein